MNQKITKLVSPLFTLPTASIVALLLALAPAAAQVGGIAPRPLLDPAAAGGLVTPDRDGQASFSFDEGNLKVSVAGGPAGYPGIIIKPEGNAPWDLSPFGHVSAQITNTSAEPLRVGMRLDNDGTGSASNTEILGLQPGESKQIKVVFGYSYNFAPAYALNSASVEKILFFLASKSDNERSFVVKDIQAAGVAGEQPPIDAKTHRVEPPNGVIFGPGLKVNPEKQITARAGASGSINSDGALAVSFPGKSPKEAVAVQPEIGSWSLADWFEVKAIVRNTGDKPVSPGLQLKSRGGETIVARPTTPIPPGGTGEITIPFQAEKAAVIPTDERQNVVGPGTWAEQNWVPEKGTGTTFASNWTSELVFVPDESGAEQRIALISAAGHVPPPIQTPEWMGKRPPVDGDWSLTFDQTFDSDAKELDYKIWNIYTHNYWDKRTHFTKDNLILKDGKMILRYEKKTGFHNDNPEEKRTGRTDYAAGYADTYGKWRQRYGYFEARIKQPPAQGLWTAIWLMPDRGPSPRADQGSRTSTARGGMEFDIMEGITGWGPFRFNFAYHWDGYKKEHKSAGSDRNYVMPDKDGYITFGLLWTPGFAAYYAQGKEIARWESPRVSDQPSYWKFDVISGGWDPVPIIDSELPSDYKVDYVRAWQRKDLASDLDGPMPNEGKPISVDP